MSPILKLHGAVDTLHYLEDLSMASWRQMSPTLAFLASVDFIFLNALCMKAMDVKNMWLNKYTQDKWISLSNGTFFSTLQSVSKWMIFALISIHCYIIGEFRNWWRVCSELWRTTSHMKYHRHPLLEKLFDPELEASSPSRATHCIPVVMLPFQFCVISIFVKLALSNMKVLFLLLVMF